jgi:hypothetical protein
VRVCVRGCLRSGRAYCDGWKRRTNTPAGLAVVRFGACLEVALGRPLVKSLLVLT